MASFATKQLALVADAQLGAMLPRRRVSVG